MSLTKEDCYRYLKEKIFLLRSSQYSQAFPKWPGGVGIEVEMLPTLSSEGVPQLINFDSQPTINQILLDFAKTTQSAVFWADASQSKILKIETPTKDNLTFEPGGQLEISTSPYPCLDEALLVFQKLKTALQKSFKNFGGNLVCVGINPWYSVDEIGLQMNKARYQAMNNYFQRIGPYGKRMMRQTCTIQLNLDFGPDEDTLIKRYMGSQMLSPIASAIFANSPVVDRKKSGSKTFRSKVWLHTDPSRTGLIDIEKSLDSLSLEGIIQSYLTSVFDANVVFIERLDYVPLPKDFRFGQWVAHGFEGVYPTLKDFETHLSLHFPDVRAKGFLELRSIDAQIDCWQSVPASFCAGVLYDPQALDQLISLMAKQDFNYLSQACLVGLDDEKVQALSKQVMQISLDGIMRLPACYRDASCLAVISSYAQQFTFAGKTPADDLLNVFEKNGGLTVADFVSLNEKYSLSLQ